MVLGDFTHELFFCKMMLLLNVPEITYKLITLPGAFTSGFD